MSNHFETPRLAAKPRWRRGAEMMAVVLLLAGCAGAPREGPGDRDLRLQAATHAFGGQFDYLLVPSEGEFKDGAFVTLSKTAGPSEMARSLGTRLAVAEVRAVRFMVTGPAPEKTAQVILDALSFHRGRKLPHLEFLYLGDPAYDGTIGDAVRALGARYRFEPYAR